MHYWEIFSIYLRREGLAIDGVFWALSIDTPEVKNDLAHSISIGQGPTRYVDNPRTDVIQNDLHIMACVYQGPADLKGEKGTYHLHHIVLYYILCIYYE